MDSMKVDYDSFSYYTAAMHNPELKFHRLGLLDMS